MRYLSSKSLALIVHVLLSIVVLMVFACSSEPATPAGPMYPREEAIAVVKEHLQTKMYQGGGRQYPCLLTIEEKHWGRWGGIYDESERRWDISYVVSGGSNNPVYSWAIYDRTRAIVATGYEPLNQMC